MPLAILVQLTAFSASPLPVSYVAGGNVDSALIRKYLDAMQMQNAARRDIAEEVTIDAWLPKLNRQATLRALRSTSSTGRISYETLDVWGDSMVRREVIARYLAAESQDREPNEIAITPVNYRFRLKGIIEEHTQQVYVFQLAPKKKKVGLFKGELWVDGQTGLPVHESGQFVKSPSVFIKRILFTCEYVTRRGVRVPNHIHSTIESRIAGHVELEVHVVNAGADGATQVKPDAE
jgi:hypothetical protein